MRSSAAQVGSDESRGRRGRSARCVIVVSSCYMTTWPLALSTRPACGPMQYVNGGWRVLTMVVGWGGWLCGTAYLAVLAFLVMVLGGLEGSQMIVRGSDGSRVLIALAHDGDVGGVWLPASSFAYLEEPGVATVDPWSGPCRLDRVLESQLKLTCGATSELISAGLRRP